MDKRSLQIICSAIGKGRRHDFHLLKQSKTFFKAHTQVIADSAYQGIKKIHPNSEHPKRGSNNKPLIQIEKQQNKTINSKRVIVEHVIRCLKIFKIMADKYRNRRKRFGLRLNLIAAIYNYQL
jgi:hypothetical protein